MLCKETLLLSFSNVIFGAVSTTFIEQFSPIIFEKWQKYLLLISPKQKEEKYVYVFLILLCTVPLI